MPIVQKTIEQLATIKKCKSMYFGPRVEEAETFLTGFRTALIAAGVPVSYESGRVVLRRRGWKVTSVGVIPSMRDRGWTDAEMIDELLDSFIEELRKIPDVVYDTTAA
jgi:hypothetical protein